MAVHPFQSEGKPVLIFQPIVVKILPPVGQKFEWKEIFRENASESL